MTISASPRLFHIGVSHAAIVQRIFLSPRARVSCVPRPSDAAGDVRLPTFRCTCGYFTHPSHLLPARRRHFRQRVILAPFTRLVRRSIRKVAAVCLSASISGQLKSSTRLSHRHLTAHTTTHSARYSRPRCRRSSATTRSKRSSAPSPKPRTKYTPSPSPNSTSPCPTALNGSTPGYKAPRCSPTTWWATLSGSSSSTSAPPTAASSGIRRSTTASSTSRTAPSSTPSRARIAASA